MLISADKENNSVFFPQLKLSVYTKTVNRFERALIGYSNFEYPLAIISDLLARGLHPKVLLLLQEQKKIRTFVAPYYHCYSID